MNKWKRGVLTCLALVILEAIAFAVHLADARTQYMVNVSQGGSAPFSAYALPVYVGHGAVAVFLLAAGAYCWRRARQGRPK